MGSISGTMLYNEKKAQARPAYASRTEVRGHLCFNDFVMGNASRTMVNNGKKAQACPADASFTAVRGH